MDIKLSDFIWTNKSLENDFCDHVVKKFDKDGRALQGVVGKDRRLELELKNFWDLPISRYDDWKEEDEVFASSINISLNEYWEYLYDLGSMFIPHTPTTEYKDQGYQVKKYEPDGYYHWHHDYVFDEGFGVRLLTFIWYLNDVSEKGCTEFCDGTKINPEKGKVLIFPANWNYAHRGCIPEDGKKYIATGWLYQKDK